ncbi:MAG: hypothetical protein WBE37_02955 [Bryobacteraceae bacterium]
MIFPMLALPDAQARRAKVRDIGYGVPSDFELNFGRNLPAFGQPDDDNTRRSPPDRRLGFLNAAPPFAVGHSPIRIFESLRLNG